MTKPSERQKKRYIVFKITATNAFKFRSVKEAFMQSTYRYIGEFGVEKAKIYIIENQYKNNIGILRVTNRSLEEFKKVIDKISEIDKIKAKIDIIGISGILKKARYKFLNKNEVM